MGAPSEGRLIRAESVEAALAASASGARFLAGGTWLMRAPVRGERLSGCFVTLSGIEGMARVEAGPDRVEIGAGVTHEALAAALSGLSGLGALRAAARGAANPGVRRLATIGGNLCAVDFAASDLAPALIALGAEAACETADGPLRLPVEEFLARRAALLPGALLRSVSVPLGPARSAHARLPLRKAGDYPVAILSLAAVIEGGAVKAARVGVGSVEPVARRWPGLEAALAGAPLDPDSAAEAARARLGDFAPRDGVEAEGWYRIEVLPALVRRAAAALLAGDAG